MSKTLIYFFLFYGISVSAIAQDIIFTKNKVEIKSKISEVSPKIIKYQKTENLDGPIYSISTNDIIFIKYQNGTYDYFDKAYQPIVASTSINQNLISQNLSDINSENLNKITIKQKDVELSQNKITTNSNEVIIQKKEENPIEKQVIKQAETQTIIKKNIIDQSKQNTIPIIKSKYIARKKTWLVGSIIFTGAGIFSLFQSNGLYNEYKTSTTNANSIHNSIVTYQTISPIAFGLAGISTIGFITNLLKENKEKSLKISFENKVTYTQIGFKYEF